MQWTANTGAFEVFSESRKINLRSSFFPFFFFFRSLWIQHDLVAVFSAFNLK